MSLKPQPGAIFLSVFDHRHACGSGLLICVRPYRDFNMTGNGGMPCISIAVPKEISKIRFSSRVKSQLICQPPVFEVQASIACCDPSRSGIKRYQSAKRIQSSGITGGDNLELAKKLQREHLTCTEASRECHDDDGFVRSAVCLRAISPLQGDDPFFVAEQVDRDREEAEKLQARQKRGRMDAYLCAKEFGKADCECEKESIKD